MKARKLMLALAVAAIGAPAASAGTDNGIGIPAGRDGLVPTRPIVSEKTAGLFATDTQAPPLVSEKAAGLWRAPVVASTPVVTAAGGTFDWSDAGIGAGVTLASVLGAAMGVLAVRRRGLLAH
jgi:hypothetical protein